MHAVTTIASLALTAFVVWLTWNELSRHRDEIAVALANPGQPPALRDADALGLIGTGLVLIAVVLAWL